MCSTDLLLCPRHTDISSILACFFFQKNLSNFSTDFLNCRKELVFNKNWKTIVYNCTEKKKKKNTATLTYHTFARSLKHTWRWSSSANGFAYFFFVWLENLRRLYIYIYILHTVYYVFVPQREHLHSCLNEEFTSTKCEQRELQVDWLWQSVWLLYTLKTHVKLSLSVGSVQFRRFQVKQTAFQLSFSRPSALWLAFRNVW